MSESIEYTFEDRQPVAREPQPAGRYCFKILEAELGYSTGAATSGSRQIIVTVAIGDKTGILNQWKEYLIFSDSCKWKIDAFLKSIHYTGKDLKKGEKFMVNRESLVGRRGWANVTVEDYTTRSGESRKRNAIGDFIKGNEPLERDLELAKQVLGQADPFDNLDDDDVVF